MAEELADFTDTGVSDTGVEPTDTGVKGGEYGCCQDDRDV